jgi:hypothetical protein
MIGQLIEFVVVKLSITNLECRATTLITPHKFERTASLKPHLTQPVKPGRTGMSGEMVLSR